jgi:hypothetical protein
MRSARNQGARGLAVVVATLGLLASVAQATTTELSNGVPVTGLAGAAGSERHYRIEVPPNQDELEIRTFGGTGDVDLYVRRDAAPTTSSYDHRPYQIGNDETVTVEKPAAGTWYIMLRGFNSYSGVTLQAAYSGGVPATVLTNGVPVERLSGATSSEQFFVIEVPAGQTQLEIKMSGGTGDADLYVRRGEAPTVDRYDYRPYLAGNNETVTIRDPAAGRWHIMVKGRNAYSGVTLVAGFGDGILALDNDVPLTGLTGPEGSERFYRIDVPAGQSNLEIRISGGTGDADLYVKFGSRPTTSDYDHRPFLIGNDETVTVANPAAGAWHIMVRAYRAYSGLTLRAVYGEVRTLQNGVPVPNLSGVAGSERFFKIEVPAGQRELIFQMSGGTGNADMYIRRGSRPTTATWDHRSTQPDNNERVVIDNPQAGAWHVMLRGVTAYNGTTLEANYRAPITVTLLKNNEPVTGISGAANQELFYRIEVPAGQERLEIRMSGGTGDADLYVKHGSAPKVSDYDYRPYQIGNDESVEVRNPAAGTWFIMIRGHKAFAGVTLVAGFRAAAPPEEVTTLQNDVAVTGIGGAAGSQKFYKIEVPAGQARLEIATSGGTGDVDLYVRRGAKPSTSEWDYRPFLIGNNERVTVDNPQAGTWYVMLHGYTLYSGVTLKATYSPLPEPVIELRNGIPVEDLSGAVGSEQFFKIEVPAGQASLVIAISGGTGDADLYVRRGSKPTLTSYDYRPYLIGNDETVEVADPAAGTWYVMLRGFQAYARVTLVARYEPVPDKVTALDNGVPVRGLEGAVGSEQLFSIEVPAGQDFLHIEIAGGTGNADLYVRKGAAPTTSKYDHRPYRPDNNEKVEIAGPDAAIWYILVHGRQGYREVTLTAQFGVRSRTNNFASDPACVALWRFDSEAFTDDSIGTNRLRNHGASPHKGDFKVGTASADFRPAQNNWMSIEDHDLSANFPTKSGDKNVEMSICFWMKPRSAANGGTLISKFQAGNQAWSWRMYLGGTVRGFLRLTLGFGSGNSLRQFDLSATHRQFTLNQWYHVAFTYHQGERKFRVRVWDDVGGKLLYDYVDSMTSPLAVTTAPLTLGRTAGISEYYDGLLDEVVVFNRVLTVEEIDSIRQGRFEKSK